MCYNCEGEIDLEVIVCPYCAADLREEKPEQQRPTFNQTASVKNLNTQQSLYPSHFAEKQYETEEAEQTSQMQTSIAPEEETKNIFGPTLLLALGAQLLLFGLLLALFSHNGQIVLKWDARLWYIYVFASAPLLIFGYKSLSKL